MDFWGAEVEAGEVVTVTDAECPIFITQIAVDNGIDGGSAQLYVTVDGKRLVIGTLSQNVRQISCELSLEKEFSLSHSLKSGSVYFIGQSADKQEDSMPIAKPATTSTLKNKTCKSVLQPCSSSKTNPKRQKIHKESEANLKKQKIDKQKKIEEKKRKKEEDSCLYGCKEADGNNEQTIFVKGFQHLRPRDEIKNELANIFASCGKIKRLFVPTQCVTCCPLGHAFINFENGPKKALKLNGSYMGGRKLRVKMATHSNEYYGYEDYNSCDRCQINVNKLIQNRPKTFSNKVVTQIINL